MEVQKCNRRRELLGEFRGMLPQKILKLRYSEMLFSAIFRQLSLQNYRKSKCFDVCGNVWFQKISIPPPPHGRSLEFPRGRGSQREKFPREVGAHVELLSRGCKT